MSSALLWLFHVLVALISVLSFCYYLGYTITLASLNPSAFRTHGWVQCGDLTGVQFWSTWAGRLFWEGVYPGCSVSTEPAVESGKLWFSHQFPSNPFCFWILNNAVKKNYSKLRNRQRGCFFKASWNWLAGHIPQGLSGFLGMFTFVWLLLHY